MDIEQTLENLTLNKGKLDYATILKLQETLADACRIHDETHADEMAAVLEKMRLRGSEGAADAAPPQPAYDFTSPGRGAASDAQWSPTPLAFNYSLSVFVTKGEDPSYQYIALSLTRSSNKIIAGVVHHLFKYTPAATGCILQNGVVHGRQLVANVTDPHAHGRIAALGARGRLPVLAAFDFGAALPMLSQKRMDIVFRVSGAPAGFIGVVRGL